MADAPLTPCDFCGMPCAHDEYHPYAACLMFKACHSSEVVRANLDAVVEHGRATPSPPVAAPPATPDTTTLEAAMRAIEQALSLIGEPQDERMRTVRRVLRGAVVIAEDAAAQPQPQPAQPLTGAQIEQKERFVVRGPGGGYVRTSLGVTLMDRESADQLSSVSGDYETVPVLVTITAPSTPTPPEVAP